MTIQKRNIVTCIILCFVTCGIYVFIWDYKLWTELYRMNDIPSTAGKELLLGFVTCGIYFIYMYYKMGQLEDQARKKYGLPPKDSALIYLLFGIFTGGLIANAVAQHSINKDLIDVHNDSL
ncbi:MAG: DUF4234 domain-containing protein [Defluviitaleaceae bacterium]|nr:DUF4234 domain-containing protein [Defluviitaleaceae bacterium]